jgi:thiopeptide-type bacteriocin biosynthesis protein
MKGVAYPKKNIMDTTYDLLPELFLRAPFYSYAGYDPDRLTQVLADRDFRNAVWLASPVFYQVLEGKGFDYTRLNEREKLTIYKYYNRMCFRPTPFGSFASFSFLEWGQGGPVRLCPAENAIIHLLADRQFLAGLQALPAINPERDLLVINPTLYRFESEYRFIKSSPDEKGRLRFSLEALEAELLNIRLVAAFKDKPVTLTALSSWLQKKTGCPEKEAEEFVLFLLEAQVLFHPSRGSLIGSGGRQEVPGVLPLGPWCRYGRYSASLKNVCIAALSREIEKEVPSSERPANGQYFYAALERTPEAGMPGKADSGELTAALKVLQHFSAVQPPPALSKFIAAFRARFDQEKVPLLLALDPDAGIAYGDLAASPEGAGPLNDIRFPAPLPAGKEGAWTAAHRLLFSLLVSTRREGNYAPLVISDNDLPPAGTEDTGPWPVTQALAFRKTEDYLLLQYAGGAAATSLTGRFSAFSSQTAELCARLAKMEVEANPGVIFADIDQLSHHHVDNINTREQVYPYRVPLNTYHDPAIAGKLCPGDLYLSVSGGELLLESKKHGKRVIPRLATAYNYQHNDLGIFRLLCDLQFQGLKTIQPLDLERLFPGQAFYPRVVYGRTILCPAKWKFNKSALPVLPEDSTPDALGLIRQFRQAHHLPSKVSLGDNDQQLVFDLSSEQEAPYFLQCLKGLTAVTLEEYLPPARQVKTGNKPLAGQFIAFFSHQKEIYRAVAPGKFPVKKGTARNFLLGSDWLYLKIYCTPQAGNELLSGLVSVFVARQQKHIRKWFFIRYMENGYHLRLRFCAARGYPGRLIMAFYGLLRASGGEHLIRDFQGDTYKRELERYGPELIDLAEDVFHAGSKLVCRFINSAGNTAVDLSAFRLGMVSAHGMIRIFYPERQRQIEFMSHMADSLAVEFAGGKALKTDLDLQYRQMKKALGDLLENLPGAGLLKDVNEQLDALLHKTSELAAAVIKTDTARTRQLLADIVHMQLNRTFREDQRRQEFLVYYFLHKYAVSQQARSKQDTYPA